MQFTIYFYIEALLVFVLVALTAGNNLSVSSGTLITSKTVKKRYGILIAILGYISGFLVEGNFLRAGISKIVSFGNQYFVFVVFSIAILIFIIAHKKRVPESLSITLTSALFGTGLALNTINLGYAFYIVIFWVLAGVISFMLCYFLMKYKNKLIFKKDIWKTVSVMKVSLIILAFFTSFTLGANTIGLIYASIPSSMAMVIIIILGIIVGSVLLSSGELKRIGNEIIPLRYSNALITQAVSVFLVELATTFSIPLSNTQTLTAGIYGTGLSYKTRLILKKPLFAIMTIWVVTAVISFILGYIATLIFIVH
ncbi:MAG: inorganic phosphate transporter [Candidatus Micrarchaeia archaeon]